MLEVSKMIGARRSSFGLAGPSELQRSFKHVVELVRRWLFEHAKAGCVDIAFFRGGTTQLAVFVKTKKEELAAADYREIQACKEPPELAVDVLVIKLHFVVFEFFGAIVTRLATNRKRPKTAQLGSAFALPLNIDPGEPVDRISVAVPCNEPSAADVHGDPSALRSDRAAHDVLVGVFDVSAQEFGGVYNGRVERGVVVDFGPRIFQLGAEPEALCNLDASIDEGPQNQDLTVATFPCAKRVVEVFVAGAILGGERHPVRQVIVNLLGFPAFGVGFGSGECDRGVEQERQGKHARDCALRSKSNQWSALFRW